MGFLKENQPPYVLLDYASMPATAMVRGIMFSGCLNMNMISWEHLKQISSNWAQMSTWTQ